MAKAGIQKAHRRLLGGHMKPGDRSMAEYSRDELAEPLRHLSQTLKWVRERRFDPDATRSGLWAGAARRVPAPSAELSDEDSDDPLSVFNPLPKEAEPGADDSDASAVSRSTRASSISDEVEASDAEVEEELLTWTRANDGDLGEGQFLPPYPEGGLMRGSAKPFTIHAMRLDDAATLCGVPLSISHAMLPNWPEVPWPRCRRCFKPM
jgi:hypothetical protein